MTKLEMRTTAMFRLDFGIERVNKAETRLEKIRHMERMLGMVSAFKSVGIITEDEHNTYTDKIIEFAYR